MAKYGHRTINWFEGIVNRLGGEKAAEAFLAGDKEFIIWNSDEVYLYLCEQQKTSGCVTGNEVYKQLRSKPVLHCGYLDYLLAHPEEIPEKWKGEMVFFWGNIYRKLNGKLYVRCLFYDQNNEVWKAAHELLDNNSFGQNNFAAVFCK